MSNWRTWFTLWILAFAGIAADLCLTPVVIPDPPDPDPPPSTNDPIAGVSSALPIEVLGPPDSTESFELVATNGASATHLWLRVHGLTYEGKASVAINGTNWVTLTDSNVLYSHDTEKAWTGMGGPMHTLRFSVPAYWWTLYNGTNTVNFRFNEYDGRSIGYRVLNLNLRSNTTDLIPTNWFTYDDPEDWEPPSTNAVDIAAGRDAWFNLEISEAGAVLNAKCQDCHAYDGRDLKYFNYSAKSIIERSVFHSVPRATATNIASYILSLDVPYATNARPWNPPYQPGPGMDALPVVYWAAGAGLDAVLDDDLETLDDIWPDGITTNALDFMNQRINSREIRVAMPFPDWNHWLPQVHPLDAWPEYYAATNTSSYLAQYATITNLMAGTSGTNAAAIFESRKSIWDSKSSTGGESEPALDDPDYWDWKLRQRAVKHWRNVKTWEIMTDFEIEEMGTELFGALSTDRRWFHGEIFNTSPHRLGTQHGTGTPEEFTFAPESMQWYQLQLVLNDGNRRNGSIVPIDWGYQHDLNTSAWNNAINYPSYGVMILNMVKGIEVVCNEDALTSTHGWVINKGKIVNLAPGTTRTNGYKQIDLDLRVQVAEAVVVPWLEKAESHSYSEYELADLLGTTQRNVIVNLATGIKSIGVSDAIVDRVCDFGEYLFPDYDWDPLRP